ncbi:MAG TPA: magnesium transporter CorA family protein [Gaiellaceae bacterium]|nr:magnesium transporter CorA family protein [Gaiellaceae bacterium]
MGERTGWVDLLDPTAEEIGAAAGVTLNERELALLVAVDEPRPTLLGADDHAIGVFVVPVAVKDEDRVYYQEVDIVLTRDRAITVRRTPQDGDPFDPTELQETCQGDVQPGRVAFHLADIVAERYLHLIGDLNEEIDEVEDAVDDDVAADVHQRLSALRHDVLHIRQTLSPTRDAVHRVVDGRVDGEAPDLLGPHDVTLFSDVYDKLLRANDALELSRDLLAGVRDFHQSKVAQSQNEVVQRLTAIASLLLFPTFVVGVYGQNFDVLPELHWHYGYAFSWATILLSTIAQLLFFRRKKWI